MIKYLLLISILLASCTPQFTKKGVFPKMYEEKPHSILILPPINNSMDEKAADYFSATIAEPLNEAGFYILPVEATKTLLELPGNKDILYEDEIPLDKVRTQFGADAILITRILEWDTSYYLVGGFVAVAVEFVLFSTETGAELWYHTGRVEVDTTGDEGEQAGAAGFFSLILTTAFETAFTSYISQAQKVNENAFNTLPLGRYHKKHDADQKESVPNKENELFQYEE